MAVAPPGRRPGTAPGAALPVPPPRDWPRRSARRRAAGALPARHRPREPSTPPRSGPSGGVARSRWRPGRSTPPRRALAEAEWSAALAGVVRVAGGFWVNDPGAEEVARRKLVQLEAARQVGLPVPRTLVTNDPARAARLREGLPRRGHREVPRLDRGGRLHPPRRPRATGGSGTASAPARPSSRSASMASTFASPSSAARSSRCRWTHGREAIPTTSA